MEFNKLSDLEKHNFLRSLPKEYANVFISILHCADSNKYYELHLNHNECKLIMRWFSRLLKKESDLYYIIESGLDNEKIKETFNIELIDFMNFIKGDNK